MRQRLWRQLLAVTLLGFLAWGSGVAGAAAAAKADRVNVRSRPGYSGEVVTQLKKGQAVEVLETLTLRKPATGEPPAWSKIALPAETPVWVSADHVDPTTHKVTADILNVRAGPSYEFGSLARLKRGAEVQPLGAAKDGWLRIAAPAGAYGYVPSVWLDGAAAVVAKPAVSKSTNSTEQASAAPAPAPTSLSSPGSSTQPSPAAPLVSAAPGVASSNAPASSQLPGGVSVTTVPAAGTSAVPATAVPRAASSPVVPPSSNSVTPIATAKLEVPKVGPAPAPSTNGVLPVTTAAPTAASPAPSSTVAVVPPPPARPVSTNQTWFDQFVARPQSATNPAAVSPPPPGSASTAASPGSKPRRAATTPATAVTTTNTTVAAAAPVAAVVKDEPVKAADSTASFSRPIQPRSAARRAAANAKDPAEPGAADAPEAKPRRGPAPIPPRLAAMQADQVRPEPPSAVEGTPGRRVRREGVVIEPGNIQAPSFYGLEARDSGKTINFLFTTRETPLSWTEYYGRTVIVTGREYLDRRPFWRGIPLLDVEEIEAAR